MSRIEKEKKKTSTVVLRTRTCEENKYLALVGISSIPSPCQLTQPQCLPPLPLSLSFFFLHGRQKPTNYVLGTLQRQNTEIAKQIFPEKEYRGLSPIFHNHSSVSDLYIPTIGLPILLEETCRPILGLMYINRSHIHECGNWG